MEDFATRTYGTSGLDNRPLFGETSAKVSADCVSRLGWGVCQRPALPPSPGWVLLRLLKALLGRKLVLQYRFPLKMFARPVVACFGTRGWPRALKAGVEKSSESSGLLEALLGSAEAPRGGGGWFSGCTAAPAAGGLTLQRLQVCAQSFLREPRRGASWFLFT